MSDPADAPDAPDPTDAPDAPDAGLPNVCRLVRDRLEIGMQRYGHAVVVQENSDKNWKRELVEELLDAVVYAAADVLRARGVDTDVDNSQLMDVIRQRLHATVTYDESVDPTVHLLDLTLFIAMSVTQNISY